MQEIAAVRARQRARRARAVDSKAGLTGRAALSPFFVEDLLASIEGLN